MIKKENMIYGLHPVMEAVRSGQEIDRVLFRKGLQGSFSAELLQMLKEHEIPFQFVPPEKLDRITRKNHQGVIAFISGISYQSLDQLVPMLFDQGKVPFILILDGITDVRNFGAICRTAECAGVNGIVIPAQGSAQINEEAIRTSAGALMTIPVCRERSMMVAAEFLKESGFRIIGATEHAKDYYYKEDFTQPLAIVMGSEEKGIYPPLRKICDSLVKIPMLGEVSSLNVSVAAGILIFEAVKQRMEG
jgi:23S rRNA (guanosine2251-2'-O)-methyltransferase